MNQPKHLKQPDRRQYRPQSGRQQPYRPRRPELIPTNPHQYALTEEELAARRSCDRGSLHRTASPPEVYGR